MAHNLNLNKRTGEYAFVKVGNPAWHKLGKLIDKPMTSAEALEYAQLDYLVEKRPLYYFDSNQVTQDNLNYVQSHISFGTFRTDTMEQLGHVRKKYVVFQNKDAFNIIDDIVGSLEAIYTSAGALGKGETIFLSAKLPEYLQVDEEVIDQYLVITNSHDGSSSLRILFTPICVVCNNTLQMAVKSSQKYIVIKHTKAIQLRGLHKALGIVNKLQEDLNFEVDKLVNTPATVDAALNFFNKLYYDTKELQTRDQSNLKAMVNSLQLGNGANFEARNNNTWGIYNAVTNSICNKEYSTSEREFKNILTGTGWNIMAKAKTQLLTW